jgi:hypothetical protein
LKHPSVLREIGARGQDLSPYIHRTFRIDNATRIPVHVVDGETRDPTSAA